VENLRITIISDVEKNTINLVVSGDIIPATKPVIVKLGLLSAPRAMNIMVGFKGFEISEELVRKQGQLTMKTTSDSKRF